MPTYAVREVKKFKGHSMTKHSNPTPSFFLASLQSVDNHNDGVDLAAIGQYGAAEQAYLKAIELKHKTIGEDAVSTALTQYHLGLLYIETNRLDDAERHLEIALRIRNNDKKGPKIDAAFSREHLAVVYEMKGDLLAAKKTRKSNGKVSCGNIDAVIFYIKSATCLTLMSILPYSVRAEFSMGSD